MRFYDITIRVSADAVRLAQAGPDEDGLEPYETITRDHLSFLGDRLTDTVKDITGIYADGTAEVSSVAGPFTTTGGPVVGATGPLAEMARMSRQVAEMRNKAIEIERELDRVLETIVEWVPVCWTRQGLSMEDVATHYVRALEAELEPGNIADPRSRHHDMCAGNCS